VDPLGSLNTLLGSYSGAGKGVRIDKGGRDKKGLKTKKEGKRGKEGKKLRTHQNFQQTTV